MNLTTRLTWLLYCFSTLHIVGCFYLYFLRLNMFAVASWNYVIRCDEQSSVPVSWGKAMPGAGRFHALHVLCRHGILVQIWSLGWPKRSKERSTLWGFDLTLVRSVLRSMFGKWAKIGYFALHKIDVSLEDVQNGKHIRKHLVAFCAGLSVHKARPVGQPRVLRCSNSHFSCRSSSELPSNTVHGNAR